MPITESRPPILRNSLSLFPNFARYTGGNFTFGVVSLKAHAHRRFPPKEKLGKSETELILES